MSNSHISQSNYKATTLKDASSVTSKQAYSQSFTADTWFTIISKDITVQNNSARVEINFCFGLLLGSGDMFIRLLRDGSPIPALSPASPGSRTSVTQGAFNAGSTTAVQTQTGYYVDSVDAGIHTYSVQVLSDTTISGQVNKAASETSIEGRTITFLDLSEI